MTAAAWPRAAGYGDAVDLGRYPVSAAASAACRGLVRGCRDQARGRGGRPAGRVPHPGGRRPDARPGRPAGRGGAGQRPGPHRLFGPAGDARGPGHPRALRQHSAKKAIGCDQVPAGAPAGRLYECGDLAAFIAAVLGKPVLCRGAGPLDALEVAVFGGAWPPRWSMLAIRAAGNVRGKP